MSLYVDIAKSYNNFSLRASFSLNGADTLALLGASGSGKSMTLKCIAGLLTPDEGVIRIGDRILFDSAAKINVKPQARGVGYLFQNYALFPNMTVRQNVEIAWRGGRAGSVDDLLCRYGLKELADNYPSQISGGQQQRAALARIFAYEPSLLLLDEPFSALDAYLREQMQAEMKHILKDYPGDIIMVTHSRDEAYRIANKLLILDGGRVEANGDLEEIFKQPGTVQVARITGCKNISRIRPLGGSMFFAEDWGIALDAGTEVLAEHTHAGIRAHDFVPIDEDDATDAGSEPNVIEIQIDEIVRSPFEQDVIFRVSDGGAPIWWISGHKTTTCKTSVLSIAPEKILLLRN